MYTRPFKDKLLGVQKEARTSSVVVYPLNNMTWDNLLMYFESKRNGGGDVIGVKMNTGFAVVEFADYRGTG